MRAFKWLGLGIYSLVASPAWAQPSAAFPAEAAPAPDSDSPPAPTPESSFASNPAPAPVAPQQLQAQPDDAGSSPPLLPPPTLELREVDRWYGGYVLMADGLSLGAAIAGGIAEDGHGSGEPFFWIAGGGYLFAAPIVHLVHGNPGRAAGSLGMRVGLPLAFFGTGVLIEDCPGGDFCGLASFVIGVPLGMATAIALDASLLARDTVQEPLTIVPTARVDRNSASIGVIGTF